MGIIWTPLFTPFLALTRTVCGQLSGLAAISYLKAANNNFHNLADEVLKLKKAIKARVFVLNDIFLGQLTGCHSPEF